MKNKRDLLNLEGLINKPDSSSVVVTEQKVKEKKDRTKYLDKQTGKLEDAFAQVKNKVTYSYMTDEAKGLYTYLLTHDQNSTYRPGYQQIMEDLHWSRSKTTRAIRELEARNMARRIQEQNEYLNIQMVSDESEWDLGWIEGMSNGKNPNI